MGSRCQLPKMFPLKIRGRISNAMLHTRYMQHQKQSTDAQALQYKGAEQAHDPGISGGLVVHHVYHCLVVKPEVDHGIVCCYGFPDVEETCRPKYEMQPLEEIAPRKSCCPLNGHLNEGPHPHRAVVVPCWHLQNARGQTLG